MCTKLDALVAAARSLSQTVDATALTGEQASRLFAGAAELERLAGALKLLVAPRLKQSTHWARSGHRSAEEWMAKTAGVGLGEAKRVVETAGKLEGLEATEQALRSGKLSLAQVGAVAEAAVARPESEADLLTLAQKEPVRRLRDEARRVVLESRGTVEERYERQRKLRSFRHWIDDEGMVAGQFRLTPDIGSAVVRAIGREADRHFRSAYQAGRREPAEAYAADAFASIVTGEGRLGKSSSGGPELVVLVSRDALVRGEVDRSSGELCEVPGFGGVPVSVARDLLDDCFLKAVVHDGTRITHVKHFGRRRPAELDTALLAQNVLARGELRCVVEGCSQKAGLEWDHREPLARGGPTSADNLQPMCGFHNRRKAARAP